MVKTVTLTPSLFPDKLRHIPVPPRQLFVWGADVNELVSRPCITVVGSRKVSAYGRTVTMQLTEALVRAGVIIISGLALGVDSLAHKSVLDAGGITIAVLPGGLDRIYPASHAHLAQQIIGQGGALVTEYKPNTTIYPSNFIARNRITSGLSDGVLITEAAERSGTLSTARFALEQGKDVFAVPGNITSPTSAGTNNLIKSGATPVTSADDILAALGLATSSKGKRGAPHSPEPSEQTLLDLIYAGTQQGDELLARSGLDISTFNQTLTMLEIKGLIRPLGGSSWALT